MTIDPIRYLVQERKLDEALLAHMGVKPVHHDQIGNAVVFPYRRDGKPYAGKFRAVEKKDWRSSHGVTRGLFNEDCLRDGDGPVVITEGEIDALSVMQAGYTRAVSLPDGWTADGGKRQVLIDVEAQLRAAPYVIVAGDNDEAGASLPRTVANIIPGHDVRYVRWPEGCKDANDVLVLLGEGDLSKCLTEAKRMDPPGGFITGISDLPPMPTRRVLRMGMEPFNHKMAFEVGTMSVGTGTPGAGKSTFTTFAAYHVAKHEDIRVGMLGFETHPYRTRDQLARLHCQSPWDDLHGEQMGRFLDFADRHFRIVHRTFEEGDTHHLAWLRDTIHTLAVRDNCKLIIVDPWNELEHLPEPGESMTSYINFALQQIRQWAQQYDTHICVIAHPRKMPTDQPRSPTGYDIADSAAFFNKPALGFSVHKERDEDQGIEWVMLTTWKVRETQLYGFNPGRTKLQFHDYGMTYSRFEDDSAFTRKEAHA
ncbi:toprim domain-containing protein [Paracoccus homiensis]|uniref:Twinkle protein n=1 Tax=Paracoccus homiensis TaxID=364199 RepID=A0A1I0J1D4_9RHOB|nr:toprim domain-containing protein [Paracoccus homiensis]SEU02844.1 twinkle protein [Paracoccus homiensis]